jgi:hypothetical protein
MRKLLTFLKKQNPCRGRQGSAGGWLEASNFTRCRPKDPRNPNVASRFLQARSLSNLCTTRALIAVAWTVFAASSASSGAHAQMLLTGAGSSKSGGGGVFTGVLDIVPTAVAGWGLRAPSAAYATGLGKLANICTPSDALCADVNSDANGNFNLAGTPSLTCNNSTSICTIKTFYDLSGHAAMRKALMAEGWLAN